MKELIGPYSTAPGRRHRWSFFVIWPEDGIVFLENQRDGEVSVLTCRQAAARLEAFKGDLEVLDRQKIDPDQKTRTYAIHMFGEIKKACEILDEVIKEAKAQGDPNDPAVAQKKLVAFLRARRHSMNGAETLPAPDLIFKEPIKPIVFGAHSNRPALRGGVDLTGWLDKR